MATPSKSTLLDLVQAVNNYTASDDETVATVAALVNNGHIVLCGNFAGAKIDMSVPASMAPRSPIPFNDALVTALLPTERVHRHTSVYRLAS